MKVVRCVSVLCYALLQAPILLCASLLSLFVVPAVPKAVWLVSALYFGALWGAGK